MEVLKHTPLQNTLVSLAIQLQHAASLFALCKRLKAKKIILHTILLGVGGSQIGYLHLTHFESS